MEQIIKRVHNLNNAKRWDYRFHQRKFSELEDRLNKSPYPLKSVRQITEQVIDGTHYTPEYTDESGILFLMARNVKPFELTLENVSYITREEHLKLIRCKPNPGDVLVTKDGTIGVAAVVPDTLPEFNIFVSVMKVRPLPVVSPHYLAAFINSEMGQLQIQQQIKGASITHIHLEDMKRIRIPLPPRPIQDRIAVVMQDAYAQRREKLAAAEELLGGIDEFLMNRLEINFRNISKKKRFLTKIENISGSRFCVDFHLPQIQEQYHILKKAKNCKILPLGRLIEQIANGATPRGANYLTEGIPFFRIQNVTPNGIDLSDIRYISELTHKEMRRSQTKPRDLLMTITGRVGTAAVIPENIQEGNVNQHIVILRPKPNSIDVNYLALIINSPAVQFQAQHKTTGTTRIALDYTAIKSLLIPVPPIKVQKVLVEEVSNRRLTAQHLRVEAETIVTEAKARVERMILGEETP